MMFQYKCLNPISPCGTSLFTEEYKQVEELQKADAVLVRSAAMHDMQDVPNLLAVARAGAGVNNIPIADYSEKGIVVFNTPGANANGVKELVIAGMLLASRDLIGGNKWVEENKEDPNITKAMEKAKKAFAGREIQNKKIGVIGLGAIGVLVANAAHNLNMEVYGYDPFLSVKSAWNLSRAVHHVSSIDEIFEKGLPIMELEIVDALVPDLEEEVMDVNLVQRMHKSGRKVNFRVIVAVGNKNGYVGLGQGKAKEVGPAIRKAVDNAKYNLIKVRRGCGDWGCVCGKEHTVPFKVQGKASSVSVSLMPAPAGVGLVVGDVGKTILNLAGIKDVWSQSFGQTQTTVNFANAIFDALKTLSAVKASEADLKKMGVKY